MSRKRGAVWSATKSTSIAVRLSLAMRAALPESKSARNAEKDSPTASARNAFSLPMNLDSLITQGPLPGAQAIVLYGVNGVGKSTLASLLDSPLFWDSERSSRHLKVKRASVLDLDALERACAMSPALVAKEGVRTLVVDTIDGIEKLLRQKVAKKYRVNSIAQIKYGNGFVYLREEFDRFLVEVLDAYIAAGIHVLVIGHSRVKRVQPPGLKEAFDRFELKLDEANSHRLKEWADAVLFFTWDLRISETGDGRPIGVGGKERQIWTQYSPAFDAKCRVALPEKVEATIDAIRPVFCDYEPITPQAQLIEAISDLDPAAVIAFLIGLGCLAEGQTLANLSEKHAREILRRLVEFKSAITRSPAAAPSPHLPSPLSPSSVLEHPQPEQQANG